MEENLSASYTDWRNNTLVSKMETDKKYMILRMGNFLISTAGLGWYVLYMLRGIRIAVENGFIPVVDWKNCKIPQYSASKVGKENVWEYFFEQPCYVNVEQAYASEDFLVIDDVRMIVTSLSFDISKFTDFYDTDTMIWREYFQKYIRLKKEVEESFEVYRKKQLKKNYIGVLARGTDYTELKPVGHSKPILIDEIFEHLDTEEKDNRIFLATEDEGILEKFERKYPGRIDTIKAKRYKQLGYNTLNIIYKEEDGYERDIKYLCSLYMISKCKSCIYSACGGGIMASLMRKSAGMNYNFLYHGCNKAKGVIVGSYIERMKNKVIFMGKKPIMFYSLNTLKLLDVEEVDLILTEEIKLEYQRIIGDGKDYGMKINYIVSNTCDVIEYMKNTPGFMKASKLILLFSDFFIHGKDVIKEIYEKVNKFDGAYIWGAKSCFLDNVESIQINNKHSIPVKAYTQYVSGNYSLVGRYIFDYELSDIIEKLTKGREDILLADIINEYVNRKKIFFLEHKRGIIYSKITDENTLEKTNQLINIIEEIQNQRIGDFESFKVK